MDLTQQNPRDTAPLIGSVKKQQSDRLKDNSVQWQGEAVSAVTQKHCLFAG